MVLTNEGIKKNGWLVAFKREQNNIIKTGTLKKVATKIPNEPVILTMETGTIKLGSHGGLVTLKFRKETRNMRRGHILSICLLKSLHDNGGRCLNT
jgi:hypothetical protein